MPITSKSSVASIIAAYEKETHNPFKLIIIENVVKHSTRGHLMGLISAHITLLDECTSEKIQKLVSLATTPQMKGLLIGHYKNRMQQLNKPYKFRKLSQLLAVAGMVVETATPQTALPPKPVTPVREATSDTASERSSSPFDSPSDTDDRLLLEISAPTVSAQEVARKNSQDAASPSDESASSTPTREEPVVLAAAENGSNAFHFSSSDIANPAKLASFLNQESHTIIPMIQTDCRDKNAATILKLLKNYGEAIHKENRNLLKHPTLQTLMSTLITEAGHKYQDTAGTIPNEFRAEVRRAIEPGKRGATRRTLSGVFHPEGSEKRKWYNKVVDNLKKENQTPTRNQDNPSGSKNP